VVVVLTSTFFLFLVFSIELQEEVATVNKRLLDF